MTFLRMCAVFCFSCRVMYIAWDFTKLLFSSFLDNCKGTYKSRNYHSVLTTAIYKLFPSPNLTIIIIIVNYFFYNHQCMQNKSKIRILLLLTLSLCSCSCKIASYSPLGQTLSNPKLFPLWRIIIIVFIISVKSVIISMKG